MWMFKINNFVKVVKTNIPNKEFKVYLYCNGFPKPIIFYLSFKDIVKFLTISNL